MLYLKEKIRFLIYKFNKVTRKAYIIILAILRWIPCKDCLKMLTSRIRYRHHGLLSQYLNSLDQRYGLNESNEFASVAADAREFVKTLLTEIVAEDERFCHKLIPTGSYYQGSKLNPVDEFDFTVILTSFGDFVNRFCKTETASDSRVYVTGSTNNMSELDKWKEFMEGNKLEMEKVIAKYIEILEFSIKKMAGRVKGFFKFGCFVGTKSSTVYCSGPSVSFILTFDHCKGQHKFMTITIDVCLAVEIKESPLKRIRRATLQSCLNFPCSLTEPFILVFHPSLDLVLSSALIEQKILTTLHPSVKKAPRILKILKENHLPLQTDGVGILFRGSIPVVQRKLSDGCTFKGISVGVKTYALKTIIYHELAKCPYNFQWTGENFSARIISMIEMLIYSLKSDLACYFLSERIIIQDYIFVASQTRDEQIQDCAALLENLKMLQGGDIVGKLHLEDRFNKQAQNVAKMSYDPDRDGRYD